MALLHASSRRFARRRDYSHNERRNGIEHVHVRIRMAAPNGRPAATPPAMQR